jgi:hypothetical protein
VARCQVQRQAFGKRTADIAKGEMKELMSIAKLIVAYPRPLDVEAFEKVYREEHVPLAVAKLAGKTKIVATKVLGSPQRHASVLSSRRDLFSVKTGK